MQENITKLRRGRHFFAGPGPTNIPDSVLHAVAHYTVDFNAPDFMEVYQACVAGLKRVLRTEHELFLYAASGHGAWEATLQNLLSPGDRILMLESGYFSLGWAAMAKKFGLVVETVPADWRYGVHITALEAALRADTQQTIRAVCVVHNETSTGVVLPLPEIRAAMDTAGHPALLLVDTISSLASMDFRMDEWGVDATVGGSQKGLMLPTGISFTAVSPKAMAAHAKATLPRHYFDWSVMARRPHHGFVGTVPIAMFYGLQESLRLLEEEGLDAVFARHARLAEAVRRAVMAWTGNAGPEIYCLAPERRSNSVTAVFLPEGFDANAVRRIAYEQFNVALGGGLERLEGRVFRIGHLGDLNEPMVLGTLGAVEMSLKLAGVPVAGRGLNAALDFLTESAR
ncbi:MAG: aminotransferase class V-fold PLP-dependent enzyme [Acidobacteriia bacterium]|nr:aminotransferase class V-fold PLP-dependent enzyme [Methyloceanibacter sp.]MCL6492745.1 aminotransferase class V-fold PLP-dependent enzyme [Terriglobia bacterium]